MKNYIDLAKRRIKLNFRNYKAYVPKYNYLKAVAGIGLISGCLITPFTNFFILMIVPVFIFQRPLNTDKLRSSKIGKMFINVKFKLLSMFEN